MASITDFLHHPVLLAHRLNLRPDPLQTRVLLAPRGILNCCRQWGKSTIIAIKALHHALTLPRQTVLVFSPSERQSAEFIRRCRTHLLALDLDATYKGDGRHPSLLLPHNGSRILGLPSRPDTLRGFTADMVLIDEAARVPDELYDAIRPMLAATNGPLWLMSTPNGRRGFFYQELVAQASACKPSRLVAQASACDSSPCDQPLLKLTATAQDCPTRISPAFLERERRSAIRRGRLAFFEQEYLCKFTDTGSRTVFPSDVIQSALTLAHAPLFDPHGGQPRPALSARSRFYLGLDLGRRRDHSALVIAEMAFIPSPRRHHPIDLEPRYTPTLILRHIERIPLETRYSAIADYLSRVIESLRSTGHGSTGFNPSIFGSTGFSPSIAPITLSIDTTGVGDGAFDLFRAARLGVNLIPVNITSGSQPNVVGSTHNIPKSDLIHTLEDLLHEKQLAITADCSHTGDLVEELAWFERTDHATGHVSFAAARDSIHDDLVMAASLACYRAYTQHRVALTGAGLGYGLIQQPLW